MDNLQKARETQIRNIEAKTGKSLAELRAFIQSSGIKKHGEIRSMLIQELGLGYGDANSLIHYALQTDGQTAAEAKGLSDDDVVNEIYSGKKAGLRPLHEAILNAIKELGEFEIAPKKGYVSLRRKKQFVMVGPATNESMEIGINVKALPDSNRLKVMPPNSMCQYKLRLNHMSEFDDEVKNWIKMAFDAS